MTLNDNLENDLQQLGNAIGSDASLTKEVMSRIDEPAPERQRKTISLIREITMNRYAKLAAAAAIIIGLFVWSQIPSSVVPTAYALQDTIDAYTSIRSLHIKKSFTFGLVTRTDEIWLECDSYGNMNKIRYHFPDCGEPVGPLTIVGSYDQSEAWLPRHNLHLVGYNNPSRALGFDVSQVDPKGLVERLYRQEVLGEIILDVNEPVQKDKPIVVTVTYPAGSLSEDWKKVFYIDQGTKLVKKIEKFELRNEQYQHFVTSEFFDYNQQIDPAMFNFEGEIPADATVIDMSDVERGLLQDDMTDEEAATETVLQFFEAVIAKDFTRAGQLYSGAPDFLIEQIFMGTNQLEITSIEPAQPETNPDSKAFFCSCKVLSESGGHFYELNAHMVVRQVSTEPEPRRWSIFGSSFWSSPPSGGVTVSKTGAQPDAATYYNLEPGQFMKKWLVLDPIKIEIPQGTDNSSETINKEYFNREHIDVTKFEQSVDVNGSLHKWVLFETEYGYINLTVEFGDSYQATYAMAQVNMPQETQTTLGIGSDDSVKVWLNGKLVHKNWALRSVGIDDDKVPVTFKKSNNLLVIKVQNNGGGPWGFCCRLLEE